MGLPCVVQVAALVVLWAAFLALQLAKARHARCSWGFAAAMVAQAVLLATAAAAYVVHQVRPCPLTYLSPCSMTP